MCTKFHYRSIGSTSDPGGWGSLIWRMGFRGDRGGRPKQGAGTPPPVLGTHLLLTVAVAGAIFKVSAWREPCVLRSRGWYSLNLYTILRRSGQVGRKQRSTPSACGAKTSLLGKFPRLLNQTLNSLEGLPLPPCPPWAAARFRFHLRSCPRFPANSAPQQPSPAGTGRARAQA